MGAKPSLAVPSYAEQTGQRCVACHIGAFGPQLTELGREFKLNGYVLSDGQDHFPPVAAMLQTSFTHTNASQPGGASPGFGANDNLAADQASLFIAGRIFDHAGAFVQLTYDGIGHGFVWDNLDIRYANQASLGDTDLTYGFTINNSPTVQDLWNSTPAWGFPFAGSGLAPTPAAATLIDGGLAQTVIGAGVYGLWNDLLYVELDGYRGLSSGTQKAFGVTSDGGPITPLDGFAPYWRVALQHTFGLSYAALGAFGIEADQSPGGITAFGSDHYSDAALDATYQFTPSPDYNVSAYATYIHEDETLHASQLVGGTKPADQLSTFRANVSFTYQGTYTLNEQYFSSWGTTDPAFFGTDSGSPNSSGWLTELDYTPSGKDGSYLPDWLNVKLALQYVDYTKFDGSTLGAGDNNNLYALVWFAVPLH